MSAGIIMPTVLTVTLAGAQTARAAAASIAAPFNGKIVSVSAAAGTAPVGADMLIDVNVGGTSVFDVDADRVTIADGAQTDVADATGAAADTDFAQGALITVDVDQVGSGTAGSDVTVCIVIDADTNPTD